MFRRVPGQGGPGLSRKPHGPRQQTRLRRPWTRGGAKARGPSPPRSCASCCPWTRGGAKARWQSDRRLRPPTASAVAASLAHQGLALSYAVPLPQVRTQARSAGDQTFSAWEAAPPVPQIAPPPHVPDAAPREESSGNPKGSPQPHSSTRLIPSGLIECFFACSAAMVKHRTATCFIGFQGKTPREEAAGKNPNGTPQFHSRTRLGPLRIHKAVLLRPRFQSSAQCQARFPVIQHRNRPIP